mmetsp:Transcript_23640/g.41205  ORF Transcript_23640/g.41205 Transcript_23640/m.41205 type:complete len:110 (-) Transcript_23640:112-441(-)
MSARSSAGARLRRWTPSMGTTPWGWSLGCLARKEEGLGHHPKRRRNKNLVQKNQRRVANVSSGATNGLASSLVFTPVQGIELVDPSKKVEEANKKWFDPSSGFLSAKPK